MAAATADLIEDKRKELLHEIEEKKKEYDELERTNATFAFWHEVGVTGLGTVGTVCLGVAELVDEGHSPFLRVAAMSTTALIAVFGACNQFFGFKPTAKQCGEAVGRLNAVKRDLKRADEPKLDELSREVDQIISTTNVRAASGVVWGKNAKFGIPITVALVVALFGGAEMMVGRFGRHPDGSDKSSPTIAGGRAPEPAPAPTVQPH